MNVVQVLHMNGGHGEASYAQNSLLQKKAITMAKPIKEESLHKMHDSFPTDRCLVIADLGCSSGPNTLLTILDLVTEIHKVRRQLGNRSPLRIQAFLNDLSGNDFNSVFKELPSFSKQLKQEIGEGFGWCFVYGAPGSFYDRLFESQTLHFVHSSYSLHWLSQVPKGLGRSHKSNILLSSGSSASVINAYNKQFQTDFTTFLRCRSEELVTGGCMVFTLLGRSDDPSIKGSGYIWELLGLTLVEMVSEGLIEEETLDIFNVPLYTPSPSEIENCIKKEESFEINQLQVMELDWGDAVPHAIEDDADVGRVTCMMRAVAESMLADHFGEGLMDEVFRRYGQVLGDCMAKERTFFTNVTVSLTKS